MPFLGEGGGGVSRSCEEGEGPGEGGLDVEDGGVADARREPQISNCRMDSKSRRSMCL